MGLSVKTRAPITYSPPAALIMRPQATLESASFIGSANAKRRIPLLMRVLNTSAMNSGLAVSQEIKRKPVERNCNGVFGMAWAMRRMRSQGSSFLKRTATPMWVEVVKSMALKPTRSMTGAMVRLRAVSTPRADQRHWLPSRREVSTICTLAIRTNLVRDMLPLEETRQKAGIDASGLKFGIAQDVGMER